jgi:hypothetical protein
VGARATAVWKGGTVKRAKEQDACHPTPQNALCSALARFFALVGRGSFRACIEKLPKNWPVFKFIFLKK